MDSYTYPFVRVGLSAAFLGVENSFGNRNCQRGGAAYYLREQQETLIPCLTVCFYAMELPVRKDVGHRAW